MKFHSDIKNERPGFSLLLQQIEDCEEIKRSGNWNYIKGSVFKIASRNSVLIVHTIEVHRDFFISYTHSFSRKYFFNHQNK